MAGFLLLNNTHEKILFYKKIIFLFWSIDFTFRLFAKWHGINIYARGKI